MAEAVVETEPRGGKEFGVMVDQSNVFSSSFDANSFEVSEPTPPKMGVGVEVGVKALEESRTPNKVLTDACEDRLVLDDDPKIV